MTCTLRHPRCRSRLAILLPLLCVAPAVLGGQSSGRYLFLGTARGYQRIPGGIEMRAENGRVALQAIAGVGLRVRVRFGEGNAAGFPAPTSLATGDTAPRLGTFAMREEGDTVVLTGEGLVVRASRHPVRLVVRDASGRELLHESSGAGAWSGQVAHVVRDLPGARYYGVGEQPLPFKRNGGVFPFWNTDRYGYQPGDVPIYSTFPSFLTVRDGVAHLLMYDNGFRGELDLGARLRGDLLYTAEGGIDGGELRYYIVPGPGVDSTLARYSRLTGRTQLPPRWALGNQQSRYSYHPDTQVTNLAREFRRRDIPADVLYLDIHYMNGYRVFTWSPTEFPHPPALLDTLARLGFKVVPIIDPGVKVDSGFSLFRDILARKFYVPMPDGSPYIGEVWPGRTVYPDFTRRAVREWWGTRQDTMLKLGVRGIWNDMNEPAAFGNKTLPDITWFEGDGHPGPHVEYHNQYGTQMARASFEGFRRADPAHRPLIITRAAYSGVQRYSSVWTGDNSSTWPHLRMSVHMVLSLGLSGVPFAGSDIGGFVGSPDGELYSRWLQSAIMIPFYRTHVDDSHPRREPWVHGPTYERANRATIRLRYRLLPTLYTAFDQHARNGSPVVRPLFWGAQADSAALEVDNEYFVGDNLLIAPVVDSGAQSRSVYLPAGRWYRLGSGESFDGGRTATVSAPGVPQDGGDTTGLRGLPIFARAGAVVVMQQPLPYVDARRLDTLELHVFPGSAASELYEDAGDGYAYRQGQFRLTRFATQLDRSRVSISIDRTGAYAGATTFAVTMHDAARAGRVTVDGREVRTDFDSARRELHFTVPAEVRHIDVER
ncbi:MAG: alpha-glucosidase [Gemmatimonadetes bacterium]|nr:alpha-glucosidase [Gemmatimonadota bacterium]